MIRGNTYRVWKSNNPRAPENGREVWQRAVAEYGPRDYIVYSRRDTGEEVRLTYDECDRKVKQMIGVLSEKYGVKKGTHVAIAMRNYPEVSADDDAELARRGGSSLGLEGRCAVCFASKRERQGWLLPDCLSPRGGFRFRTICLVDEARESSVTFVEYSCSRAREHFYFEQSQRTFSSSDFGLSGVLTSCSSLLDSST
jgi:hypothetical protein